jgi:hypothetical protein
MVYDVTMTDEAGTVPVMVRMDAAMRAKLDARAKLEKRSRADVMRLMLTYALDRMPQGWVR